MQQCAAADFGLDEAGDPLGALPGPEKAHAALTTMLGASRGRYRPATM